MKFIVTFMGGRQKKINFNKIKTYATMIMIVAIDDDDEEAKTNVKIK